MIDPKIIDIKCTRLSTFSPPGILVLYLFICISLTIQPIWSTTRDESRLCILHLWRFYKGEHLKSPITKVTTNIMKGILFRFQAYRNDLRFTLWSPEKPQQDKARRTTRGHETTRESPLPHNALCQIMPSGLCSQLAPSKSGYRGFSRTPSHEHNAAIFHHHTL